MQHCIPSARLRAQNGVCYIRRSCPAHETAAQAHGRPRKEAGHRRPRLRRLCSTISLLAHDVHKTAWVHAPPRARGLRVLCARTLGAKHLACDDVGRGLEAGQLLHARLAPPPHAAPGAVAHPRGAPAVRARAPAPLVPAQVHAPPGDAASRALPFGVAQACLERYVFPRRSSASYLATRGEASWPTESRSGLILRMLTNTPHATRR